nr:unnamed protein product [Digitaria exilis]
MSTASTSASEAASSGDAVEAFAVSSRGSGNPICPITAQSAAPSRRSKRCCCRHQSRGRLPQEPC